MRGNTARHFVDIANIYGVGIKMEHGKHAIDALSRLPHDVPHKLLSDTITTYDRVIGSFICLFYSAVVSIENYGGVSLFNSL
jgi:hypothetical protein